VDRKDLQALCRIRLREAQSLARGGHCDGAYYLAGYAVECALKACIAKETRRYEFPEKKKVDASYKHNLSELVKVAELDEARQAEERRDEAFRKNWLIVQSWSEESRYRTNSQSEALNLVNAIADKNHGVLLWIKRHW
jgi:HEPN domain-containing protein